MTARKPLVLIGSKIGQLPAGDTLAGVGLGVDQTYQNLTGSRALSTSFPNTTGREIWVHVSYQTAVAASHPVLSVTQGSVTTTVSGTSMGASGVSTSISAPIPPGASYKVDNNGGGTPSNFNWVEVR